MSDRTGPRGPSPFSNSTTGATPGAPAEPNLPQHGTPLGGTPARGVDPLVAEPAAQRVVDEMNKRHESLMNPKSNPLSTALTSAGFVY